MITGVVLDRVKNVMVDAKRPLTYPPGPIRALYASFLNLSPAYVQLWKNSSADSNIWYLDWQVEVMPKYGNGTIEIVSIVYMYYSLIAESFLEVSKIHL